MDEGNTAGSSAAQAARILSALERQLLELDRLGANIAAAHLDAAIQQIRLDQVTGAYF